MKKIEISASTNPPPANEFYRYMDALDDCDIDYIHCDVMDGKFVETISLSYSTVKGVAKTATKRLDVHLMVKSPSKFLLWKYTRLKPEFLSIHAEAFEDKEKLKSALLFITKKGINAGLAINPATKIADFVDVLPYCKMFMIMTVVPGYSGQKMIEESLGKIAEIKEALAPLGIDDVTFEVDGGVNLKNIDKVIAAGADIAVSGNALYVAENRNKFIKAFTNGGENKLESKSNK